MSRSASIEVLEDRDLLTVAPFGAMEDDTAEFLLGDVLVTLVLMESKSEGAPNVLNSNSETWTQESIDAIKDKVVEGISWWEDTLDAQGSVHSLNFEFDFTYADSPVLTDYEPIERVSNDFRFWIYDFLGHVGYDSTHNFSEDIRAFNHAQRLAHDTDWAFTIFVANDENDADGQFAFGGSFRRAFAYPGGQFFISPAGRPASTFAHELGHIFWARDEYAGGGSWIDQRGYYNAQNLNAHNNPAFGFQQQTSIMANGTLLTDAYAANTSSPSSLEMMGWRDSDGDGIFDVLDVPHTLDGSGYFDPATATYHFSGHSSVRTLPNLNSSGQQNDVTINRISRAEYRIDGGSWQTAETYDSYEAELDLAINMPAAGVHSIEIRTIDADSGVVSPSFFGTTARPTSVVESGINGFVWGDTDGDGEFESGELGLSGWTVRMVDAEGEPLDLREDLDPDIFDQGQAVNNALPSVTLTAVGEDAGMNGIVTARYTDVTNQDERTFHHFTSLGNGWSAAWTASSRRLRMDFDSPVAVLQLDAVGNSANDYGRLEVYDSNDNLLERYTTGVLNSGDVETMSINRSTPDIAYAIARGHLGSAVNLDHLRFGPETETITDAHGAYSLVGLPEGDYIVETVAPVGWAPTQPPNSQQAVSLTDGVPEEEVDFGNEPANAPWQNPANHLDVNGKDGVSPLDALIIINFINSRPGNSSLPDAPHTPPPFYDVDGNGFVTALDVLMIINHLNSQTGNDASEADGEASAPFVSQIATMAEGEMFTRVRDLRAERMFVPLQAGTDLVGYPTSTSIASARPEDITPRSNTRDSWNDSVDSVFYQAALDGTKRQLAKDRFMPIRSFDFDPTDDLVEFESDQGLLAAVS